MTDAPQASRRIVAEACPLCASSSFSPLADGAESEWVRCRCDVIYKRSEPASADAAPAHYEGEYFDRYARRHRRRVSKSKRQIRDALEEAHRGRLLDVGCSLGYTLEAARALGLDACGVDVSSEAVEACRGRGFDARTGTLDALPFEDASFAVATLKHVFEHTPEPRRALAELRRVLVPRAAVFFAVPHAGYHRAVRSPETSRFYRGEAGRAHFVYYTPESLTRLLESEGFRVASVHERLVHRRSGALVAAWDLLRAPLRVPFRAIADAAGLRKEFWLVAVMS